MNELSRLAAAVPPGVREVCEVLVRAGHEAVTVGGAVRDAMLGRDPGDWDVATSAHPDAVIALFGHTIPTGLQHGTVTVMIGRGKAREAIEVTTYRGEGAYHDGRRPESVVFGVPLVEDLARRDLVVNAIAYDPVKGELHDPFDGRGDIAARRLRAVGDATARFTEDGLRVMRAIRFAATLGFELDAATEAAIPAALPSLAKVSRERVKVELDKTLGAPAPGPSLEIARRTGVLAQELPEALAGIVRLPDSAADGGAAAGEDPIWRHRLAWIDALAADAVLRATALLSGVDGAAADATWRRLKGANDERDRLVRLVKAAWTGRDGELPAPALRRVLAAAGRARGDDLVALWNARAVASAAVPAAAVVDALAVAGPEAAAGAAARADAAAAVAAAAAAILARGDALAAGDLVITGGDLMKELGIPPSREVGRLLDVALQAVLDDPTRNTRDELLAIARAAQTK
jgi:tRNA nucleotidyltransferase (CCA-adding enzyme)